MNFLLRIWLTLYNVACAGAIKFIGPEEKFLCNCADDQCEDNGNCKPGVICNYGFFGHACQYKNVFDYASSSIAALSDDSIDTCVQKKTSIEIHFTYTRVLFLRLYLKNANKDTHLEFNFNTNDRCKTCNGLFFASESTFIEYHCQCPVKAVGVIITNVNQIPICHIEVCNGRNMGLKSTIQASESNDMVYHKDGLTDGVLAFDKNTCFLQNATSTAIVIELGFPIRLSIVEIYDTPLQLRGYSPASNVLIEIRSPTKRLKEIGRFKKNNDQVMIFMPDSEVLDSATVMLKIATTFGACEIIITGDCPEGKYGLPCNLKCTAGCKWCTLEGNCIAGNRSCSQNCGGIKTCHGNGTCMFGCRSGFYGSTCMSSCSPNCGGNKDCHDNGTCEFGCRPGFYGSTCMSNCSEQCAKDTSCQQLNGTCKYGCKSGYYGHNCLFRCSPNCGGKQSCHENGTCEFGCRPGIYGSTCMSKCSKNCAKDTSCHQLNGTCEHGCNPGYSGHSCVSSCSPNCGGIKTCHENGTCEFGCHPGFYGSTCMSSCSPNCGGIKTCNDNGTCEFGCRPGFYGSTCMSNCSEHCAKDTSCHQLNGTCKYGCLPGYFGDNCLSSCNPNCGGNKSCHDNRTCVFGCRPGIYGSTCMSICSPYCGDDGSCDTVGNCLSACKPGYFGPRCLHLGLSSNFTVHETWNCHCHGGKCTERLDICSETDQCITGWFGFHCDFKDLGVFATMSNKSFNDNNNKTCYDSPNNTVRAEWETPIHFTWAWLFFLDIANVSHISMAFVNITGTYNVQRSQFRVNNITENIYELRYYGIIKLSALVIYWTGQGSLCSLSINGDHNLALGFRTLINLQLYRELKKLSIPITDGDLNGTSCVDFFNSSYKNLVYLFDPAVWISRINLYPDITKEANAALQFTVTTSLSSSFIVKGSVFGNKLSTFWLNVGVRVKSIEIKVVSGDAYFCEVEIFGECVPPRYGFACREMCSMTCLRDRCDYRGHCLSCTSGRTGPHCMDYLQRNSSNNASETPTKDCTSQYCANSDSKLVQSLYFFVLIVCEILISIFIPN